MKREIVLGALVAVGALTLTVRAYQQPAASGPKVVTADKIKDNLWVLKGDGGGGNVAVFAASNGVVVVDAKNPGWGQPILDKIKELTNKPVAVLINTHTHGDHVSGNVEFPATVDIVTQENTKTNMEKMDIFKQNNGRGLPKKTFKDKMTLMKGADQIDLYYFGPGHTNGDAIVVFPALRTAHVGDLFASKGMPLVDGANGGSVLHYSETVMKVYNGIKNVDTVINGHSNTTTTWADVKEFGDFTHDFLTWAQAALKSGKSPEAAAAEWKVPEKYQGYSSQVSTLMGGLPGRLQRLQEEMKK
jgi:glyoxylase-like metal-dependent hydrolase (beta-lactamase superfamily II)